MCVCGGGDLAVVVVVFYHGEVEGERERVKSEGMLERDG